MNRRGITLLEVLVCIAILGALIGLIIPAVQRVRDTGMRMKCFNNLKQIGLALHSYHDARSWFPSGVSYHNGKDPQPHMSWCVRVLPYLEQSILWGQAVSAFKDAPFFLDPPHAGIRDIVLPVLICPSDDRVQQALKTETFNVAFTSYLGSEGTDQTSRDGILFLDSQTRVADITDGTTSTILVGERPPSRSMHFGWWYAGWGQNKDGSAEMVLGAREKAVYPTLKDCPANSNRYQQGQIKEECDALHFWSLHFSGTPFLFADGSVRLLPYSADEILPSLMTRAGKEIVEIP